MFGNMYIQFDEILALTSTRHKAAIYGKLTPKRCPTVCESIEKNPPIDMTVKRTVKETHPVRFVTF